MLAINTLLGQQAEDNARQALLKLTNDEVSIAFLPNNSTSVIDGYLIRSGEIRCAFESKSRKASICPNGILFKGKVYETYLITEAKLLNGIDIAQKQNINFSLFVYLEISNTILQFPIYNHFKKTILNYSKEATTTQATVNGGYVKRLNAFIPINLAQIIQL